MTATKTWLITGASKGLGLALTHQLLAAGHRVAATTRNKALLEKEVGITSPQFLPLSVDLSDEASVKCAVNQALDHFGSIDVVVNNAGFGQMGTLEELSDAEARKSFDINVFGMLNVIRSVMPHLRARRSGHIMNISSMAGIQGHIPGWGVYCAAKFAVAGFTEALAAESAEFDIKVTLVYPGHMRTRFLSQGSIMSPENPIADYLTVRENEKRVKEQMDGQQIGDPEKAAALLIKISQVDNPPLHFFMGEDAYQAVNTKLNSVKRDLAIWEADTLSIGF
ncbi:MULTISPECIES: SDR family NAD(P)-dependent oxidoreductase [Yersinia]|uniref:SDR family NAD(P)-dependent oxidoreductase n=1 Tax=Yersinia TaxID=629 RepID=UPI0005DAC290|nr:MULTISPECIES: SDR family NAD(P)-dependent oxidoreductase [Yersinia]RXA97446.1 SDR family NAD(P)-dependent oxidoreductase [Yersinia sp. 2105 StPb PI]CNI25415.1 short chain dehydrogenase [Yersinia frederiksenii]CNL22800.1 short chain dehydrogenase [Yersinia frederiksenii]